MKKLLVLVSGVLLLSLITACGSSETEKIKEQSTMDEDMVDDTLEFVTTIEELHEDNVNYVDDLNRDSEEGKTIYHYDSGKSDFDYSDLNEEEKNVVNTATSLSIDYKGGNREEVEKGLECTKELLKGNVCRYDYPDI